MKKMGHHFPKERGFSGSCSDAGAKRYVPGYFRGGPTRRHDDEAQDRQLIRQEVKKLMKRPQR